MSISPWIAGAALMLAAGAGHAFDFKTVGAAPAILYDAPSTKGGKLFIAPRGMPLEVVLSYGEWVKVRDVSGDLAWTEAKALSARRNVVVRSANLKVRASADEAAAPVFIADKGLLLEVTEGAVAGWVKVRHKDGSAGYVKSADVWGI
ncbi:SH3 domain-containing protein [Janthinobacterium sp.]|uniref:SH3 domain-containing protein n=1 Tax=Janthinobacterium sp. TaxID=1871054 RepID=UPI00293D2212|nr:SH3 domain-containing protein [Janthinobacterium sp.]